MDKQAFNTIVEGIAGKIERAIADNDGKVPYGCVSKEVGDSDNEDENVENEVAASLLDLAGIGQSI